jgi:predicted metal-dependent phosphoesterase TrpH
MKFADLHLHTNFSDGTLSPQELVKICLKKKLAAIAVSDHDTVGAIEPAIKAADNKDIEVLPAIELSTDRDGKEVHILGYLIDYKNQGLLDKLSFLRQMRVERIVEIIRKLREINSIDIEFDELKEISGKGTISRLHLARLMVRKGCVKSIVEAFTKYIGDKSAAYVCGFHFSPPEAIKLIEDIKGISVLAHPYTIRDQELIPWLVDCGLKGIEVYYPEHSPTQTVYYENLAKKYNLLVTGGSDYHGEIKPGVQLGSLKVPYELVERLKREKIQ